MAAKGVCELCGFADDSYRLEENGTVMKVCKFCHDGYLERMGLSPDADKPIKDVALTLDLDEVKETDFDLDGVSGEELLQLKLEIESRKENERVKTLDPKQLDTLLNATETDKKVLSGVKKKEQRRKKQAIAAGVDDSGEDYKASEELIRSGEELQKAMEGLRKVSDSDEALDESDDSVAPLIAKIVHGEPEKPDDVKSGINESKSVSEAEETVLNEPPAEVSAQSKAEPPPESESVKTVKDSVEKQNDTTAHADEKNNSDTEQENTMSDKKTAAAKPAEEKEERVSREERVREKIHAEAHQTIDDERIQITSPEVALSRDRRPKTNLDVATSENTGAVRFFNAFKYVMHRVSYTILVAAIVLAVATVMFIRAGWQQGLIVFAAGLGAIGIGFLLMWYLSHCYELDKRAQLLRIRQQEILFESMSSECYRELRTKFTIIKALGWLLNKLSVLLPLVVLLGGNIAGIIVSFIPQGFYWLYPVISAGASVAGVLVYYIVKFAADCTAYMLDRERNQQIQQQTLLDILGELKKK